MFAISFCYNDFSFVYTFPPLKGAQGFRFHGSRNDMEESIRVWLERIQISQKFIFFPDFQIFVCVQHFHIVSEILLIRNFIDQY